MGISARLIQIAADEAAHLQAQTAALREEIDALNDQLEMATAKLRIANDAAGRVERYYPEIAAHHQCPICWVRQGDHVDLNPVPSENSDDLFRCEKGHEIELSGGV